MVKMAALIIMAYYQKATTHIREGLYWLWNRLTKWRESMCCQNRSVIRATYVACNEHHTIGTDMNRVAAHTLPIDLDQTRLSKHKSITRGRCVSVRPPCQRMPCNVCVGGLYKASPPFRSSVTYYLAREEGLITHICQKYGFINPFGPIVCWKREEHCDVLSQQMHTLLIFLTLDLLIQYMYTIK